MKPFPSGVAAFFDLDGTLISFPSLERRLFRELLCWWAIPARNVLLWLAEAVRLAPRGIAVVRQANKMYLRSVSVEVSGAVAGSVADAASLEFFHEAVDRAAWHVSQGHQIVLVTGTLELLASRAARSLEEVLKRRAVSAAILVFATRLEESGGRWTGRVLGEPMFGTAKAKAMKSLAVRSELDLDVCFAYGDSVHDRAMLECVGHAVAVNPSPEMGQVAAREGWQVAEWRVDARREVRGDAQLAERNVETLG